MRVWGRVADVVYGARPRCWARTSEPRKMGDQETHPGPTTASRRTARRSVVRRCLRRTGHFMGLGMITGGEETGRWVVVHFAPQWDGRDARPTQSKPPPEDARHPIHMHTKWGAVGNIGGCMS